MEKSDGKWHESTDGKTMWERGGEKLKETFRGSQAESATQSPKKIITQQERVEKAAEKAWGSPDTWGF